MAGTFIFFDLLAKLDGFADGIGSYFLLAKPTVFGAIFLLVVGGFILGVPIYLELKGKSEMTAMCRGIGGTRLRWCRRGPWISPIFKAQGTQFGVRFTMECRKHSRYDYVTTFVVSKPANLSWAQIFQCFSSAAFRASQKAGRITEMQTSVKMEYYKIIGVFPDQVLAILDGFAAAFETHKEGGQPAPTEPIEQTPQVNPSSAPEIAQDDLYGFAEPTSANVPAADAAAANPPVVPNTPSSTTPPVRTTPPVLPNASAAPEIPALPDTSATVEESPEEEDVLLVDDTIELLETETVEMMKEGDDSDFPRLEEPIESFSPPIPESAPTEPPSLPASPEETSDADPVKRNRPPVRRQPPQNS